MDIEILDEPNDRGLVRGVAAAAALIGMAQTLHGRMIITKEKIQEPEKVQE